MARWTGSGISRYRTNSKMMPWLTYSLHIASRRPAFVVLGPIRPSPFLDLVQSARHTLSSFQKLLMVRRRVRERIVEATAIPCWGVHKPVEVFLDIDRIEEQAFVPNRLGVFDQNSFGAIDAPHLESGPKESAVRVKFFQPRHRMEAIDRHSILAMNECENSKFHLLW